ncbi:MAG: DUF2807 domain-containing protein [Candidatus Cloacimonetes bacterium]|nr:DUF2807 domain-containing protein [Candidatus Cloacimonadota bacterium]
MRYITGFLLLALSLTGCVKGSGNVVTRQCDVSDFQRIELHGLGAIIITQGDHESLVIEAEDNIIERVHARVEGDELIIGMKRKLFVRPTKPIVYHVTVREINRIAVLGAGEIEATTPLRVPHLELRVAGAGEIDLEVDTDSLSLKVAGAGDLWLRGRADVFMIEIAGAGEVEAFELQTRSTVIEAAGAAEIEVSVSESLSLVASGACEVRYRGDARIIKQEVSGASSITRL